MLLWLHHKNFKPKQELIHIDNKEPLLNDSVDVRLAELEATSKTNESTALDDNF